MEGQQIYTYIDSRWTPSPPWKPRAVIYDDQQETLLNTALDFLESPTRATPDRLVCLLHGPTGTGKSTFAKYLAKTLHLSIYNIIASSDDDCVAAAFATLPGCCLVLIEDVNAVDPRFITSFLEAIKSLEDSRIIIVTTRKLHEVDGAFKDPELVNQTIEFQLADKDRISLLFWTTFPDSRVEDQETFARKMSEQSLSFAEV
ncbi:hypothetical protein QQZ08_010252 [Neonectria magnoliae]|uniref:AAA+ ATPase domain-containing protein n=1 Tax=Neonectria magnoliae TaxID=2732573 RepID=A0ABR1HHS5_9HYPO